MKTEPSFKTEHSIVSKTDSQSDKISGKISQSEASAMDQSDLNSAKTNQSVCQLLWVDKYKPSQTKNIVGQPGNVKKLQHWLTNWHKNQADGVKPSQGRFFGRGSDDGAGFKAALLSGPPGVGKTTTATLVCQVLSKFSSFTLYQTTNF